MKKLILFLIILSAAFTLSSCSGLIDFFEELFGGEEDRIVGEMLDEEQQDILSDLGMQIYSGSNPPEIEGYYVTDDLDCVEDTTYVYLQDLYYYWNFFDQNGSDIKVSYDNGYSDTSTGQGSFIFGEGDDFTIYAESEGISSGIPYTTVNIYSGTLTSSGIQNFTQGFIMTDKDGDDTNYYLMGINEARIYEEGDGMADKLYSDPGFGRGLETDAQTENAEKTFISAQ